MNPTPREFPYNGLQIEMQLRSRLQHAWATAVETAGTFLQLALKSSQGPAEWLEFFSYVSSAFALLEKRPPVPGTPSSRKELGHWIRVRAKELEIVHKLSAFGVAAEQLTTGDAYTDSHYFLLELRPDRNIVDVKGFSFKALQEANDSYAETERRLASEKVAGAQAVLVSVDKLSSLRKAYPNFYLDTTQFLNYLQQVM